MAKSKGMQRSDFEGHRYKPRESQWLRGNPDEDNFTFKREFENIGVAHNGLVGAVLDLAAAAGVIGGAGGSPSLDSDENVRINPNDHVPGHLQNKLLAGPGITITVAKHANGGLAMTVSTVNDIIVVVHDFNTHINKDGSPRTGTQRLEETFDHPIPHEHYTFEVYRPTEDMNTMPVDTWPDGTVRGRYQIRWKNVIEKKSGRFGLRFHQPEFGTIVLYGSRTILRV